ncbi:MAG: glycosyltransferase [Acidobacteriota bacterium]|nr:glycosyltransferase [Acidobacteriota bacterium]
MITFTIAIGLLATSVAIVAAYAAWLMTSRRRVIEPHTPAEQPPVLIVVAVYDEAPLIERKLVNLAALTYPWRRVVIVDGGSTDGTIGRVSRWIASHPDFALLETQRRNKTAQLNDALAAHREEAWVLVTDADALLEADTLERLFDIVASDDSVSVVGTRVRPTSAHALESLHWHATDWLRAREHDRGSAAIVAAPCYLARREHLNLPHDVIADDVHVACSAMMAGRRVGQSSATVLELRSPSSLHGLLKHKYRKGDAYLREIMRFLPLAGRMPAPMRTIFLWRAALLTIVPLLSTIGGTALVAALVLTWGMQGVLLLLAPMLLLFIPAARGAALAVVLAAVSAAALFTYPFSRQAASFPKILQPSEYPLSDET